jgi:alpha-glucoside transport system permease protein
MDAARPGAGDVSMAKRRSTFWARAPIRFAVLAICFLWFLPTMGLLITSVRDPAEIASSGWWTSLFSFWDMSQWTLDNYANVITSEGMAGAFVNSLIVAIPATVIPITVAAFAAYAFAWMRFPFRVTIFIVVVGLLVVPLQMALIPVLRIYSEMGIAGTFLGIWLAHTGFGLPLAVFLLYNFISQLPEDLFETASIDGATHFQMFTRIVLPLSVPALAAFAIFQFLWVWNDLLVALVFLGPQDEVAVATVKLNQLIGNRGQAWHLLTAGAFVTMALPLLVFLALQRYFIRGILAGSVKG